MNIFTDGRIGKFTGLLVAIIAFCVYANSLGNGFVWDDTNVIVTSPVLRGSPLALFSSIDATRDYELLPYYRPLTILTFLIEERLHGLAPFPMHLFNLLLHAANAFLVYRLARSLINDTKAALIAGLLFAVHPINTEAVDFLSGGRNTMLSCFFALIAYLIHRRSILSKKVSIAFAGAFFFTAGLFSKETAMMILPFIIAQEISSLRENVSGSRLNSGIRLFPYGIAAVCYLIMRWLTLSNLGIQTSIIPGFGAEKLQSMYKIPDLWTRLLDNIYIIPRYLLTLILPTSLSPAYIVPRDLSLLAAPIVVSWLCIIAILGWLLIRRRSRAALFGLFWFAAFYLPVSGMVWFPSLPMSDRYLYMPAIGIWLVLADQFVRLLPYRETALRLSVAAALLVLIVLAGLTVRRNMDWKSDITLFSRLAEQYPDNAFGHAGIGEAYLNRDRQTGGDLTLAERELEKALALNPIVPGVNTNMGYIRLARGDSEGAVRYYTIALGIYPLDKEALLNRAIALENIGRQEEALRDFKFFLDVHGYELAEARPYAEARIRALTQ